MSKFNTTNSTKTVNKCGHVAYAMKDDEKLVTQVLTSMFGEEKYYGDNTDELIVNAQKVLDADPGFVANLARYARKEMHLRSVSHALAALIAHHEKGKQFTKVVVADVVERPDDITEILACYLALFGKPISNALKKALAAALGKFNAFQISKYNGGNKSVKFRDVLRLTHPVPKDKEQEELFGMILSDTLPVAERWETEVSKNGNKKEVWEKLIAEGKLGYMAMLRNLRNILNARVSNIDAVYKKLSDREEVKRSKQLPFRFLSAYREVCELDNCTSKMLSTLEKALSYSVDTLPRLAGKTVIAIDSSGSMGMHISMRSSVNCSDIANLLGALAAKICEESIIYSFDTELQKQAYSDESGILSFVSRMPNGGGTDLKLVPLKMLNDKIYADRLIMLSDNEINSVYVDYGFKKCCQPIIDEYRKKVNPNLWVHAVDMQGYGTQQFIGAKTNLISGWGDSVLSFISLAEEGITTQVEKIRNYR